jgi:transposase
LITLQADWASKDHPDLVKMLSREPRRHTALERAPGKESILSVLCCPILSLLDWVNERRRKHGKSDPCSPHLPIAEVKQRMKMESRAMTRQRWLIIYNALVEPRRAEEIARHCGVSKATVYAVISRYNRLGVAGVDTPGQGGRRRQYLTLEEEKEFLAPFFAQAERGEIATVGQIWRAFEQRVGHAVDDSTIYRLLHRHGWRKLMPRPKHPKTDEHAQEQFIKNFPTEVDAAVATREAGDERKVAHHGAG